MKKVFATFVCYGKTRNLNLILKDKIYKNK